jgi:hypothetical protein
MGRNGLRIVLVVISASAAIGCGVASDLGWSATSTQCGIVALVAAFCAL